ncbi:hypothetical protein LCGC14_2034060 [marine sediment metagenome]|uniref:Uncharacterized protein n=1 Tax=marine sediment metagenome TaxID=412755 RepID=A0A0F9H7B2_9ZZZZ
MSGDAVTETPIYRSKVEILPQVMFYSVKPRPNWWWRLWQWCLLGWRWTAL